MRGGVVPYVCVAHFATFFVWFTMILIAPLRLQLVLGASATTAGALLTPGIVVSPFSAFFAGQIVSRTGRCRLMCRLGAVFQVIGLGMLLYVPAALPEVWVLVSFAIVGVGTGFAAPSMTIAFQNAIPHRRLGAGMGLLSLFRQFGSSVGTALVGAIVGASVAVVASASMDSAIQQAVVLQLGMGLVVLLATLLMADLPLGTSRGSDPELVDLSGVSQTLPRSGRHSPGIGITTRVNTQVTGGFRMTSSSRSIKRLAVSGALALGLLGVTLGPALAQSDASRVVGDAGYTVGDDAIWNFYNQYGGVATFGAPISREFTLFGNPVQVFEDAALQVLPDGSVQAMQLTDPGLVPTSSLDGLSVPGG